MAAGNDGLIVDFDAAMAGPDVTMTGAIGGVSDTTQASKLAVDNWSDDFDVPLSSTASISSSLYEHVEENGHTYHKYKEGNLQHALCKIALHKKLYLAPIKKANLKRVLDFGTGTGIWAIEMAQENPDAQVVGSDLSPIQPEFIPANLTFEVDDIDDEWVFQRPFSFIHARLTVFCMRDPISVFRKAFNSLEPGGYLEMQDASSPLRSLDGTIDGTALREIYELMTSGAAKLGIDTSNPSRYKAMFEEVGFVDVTETVFELPIGPWGKSKYHKKIGSLFRKDLDMGCEGMAMGMLTRIHGMQKEEVMKMVTQVKLDMANRDVHAYQNFFVVYGRKPLQ